MANLSKFDWFDDCHRTIIRIICHNSQLFGKIKFSASLRPAPPLPALSKNVYQKFCDKISKVTLCECAKSVFNNMGVLFLLLITCEKFKITLLVKQIFRTDTFLKVIPCFIKLRVWYGHKGMNIASYLWILVFTKKTKFIFLCPNPWLLLLNWCKKMSKLHLIFDFDI